MSGSTDKGLIAEIKVLLQEELEPIRGAIHQVQMELSEFKGRSIERMEFERALQVERTKREALETDTNRIDKELAAHKASTKVYVGIAAAVASIVGAGIASLIVGLL